MRRLIFATLAASLLVVGLAVPALAQPTFEGPVTPGQSITVTCDPGFMVLVNQTETGTVYGTQAIFWRNVNRKGPKTVFQSGDGATQVIGASGHIIGFTYVAPKGAKYGEVSVQCVLIPPSTQTLQFIRLTVTTDTITVSCPAEMPYLISVQEVVALDPMSGAPLALSYTQTATGVEFVGILDWLYRVTITCSSAAPA